MISMLKQPGRRRIAIVTIMANFESTLHLHAWARHRIRKLDATFSSGSRPGFLHAEDHIVRASFIRLFVRISVSDDARASCFGFLTTELVDVAGAHNRTI